MTGHAERSMPIRALILVEKRVLNPLFERILQSPIHPLLSSHLAIIEYEGQVSGNWIRTPVVYGRLGKSIVATTDRNATTWWKNFRGGHPATLWIKGRPIAMYGQATLDTTEIVEAYAELSDRSRVWRWTTRGLGVSPTASKDEREAATEDVVLIVFDECPS